MIQKVHHVAIAVHSLDAAMRFYRDQLGLSESRRVTLADRGLHVAFLQAGETRIELLEPFTEDNTVQRFLERRGEGLHHVCFQSDGLEQEIQRLSNLRVEFIDTVPRPGAEGRVAFIQPDCAAGVLVELLEEEAPSGAEGP
ncbi:MAG: methylmalonyl-CoA epimerase [Chloroflexi bacterium]|nr:methylmalonyl-CoA epimerase [Chloroflexota bacterium]